jgi:eukaryotic-like serine/threonine-protein kinase
MARAIAYPKRYMGLARTHEPGSSIGTYVLERRLGTGGMAEVFLARRSGPHGFQKRVAIKRILPEFACDAQFIQMFCDEARIAATLSHPNIVQIVEFGEHEGELYLVMEFVDGISASTILRRVSEKGETIPVGPALYVAREVLLALAFAHEATDEDGRALGVVHRDVSPSNILISRTGTVKLIDFGITRSFLAERRTVPGELKGKLRYMSPEQVLGGDVDSRSDLFAVGIVLAEMLAGKALFSGRSDLDVLTRISRGELGFVREGSIAGDVTEILEAALAHRPNNRFQTARDFARMLEDAALARGIRLDDTIIVPYLHSLGVLPSSSGTRRAELPSVPSTVSTDPPAPEPGPPRRKETSSLRIDPARFDPVRLGFESGEHPALREQPTPATEVSEMLVAQGMMRTEPPAEPRLAPQGRLPSGTYRLRSRSGELLGPFPRSDLLSLIATGKLSSRSPVALGSGAFLAVANVPALAPLATHPAYQFRDDDRESPETLERIDPLVLPMTLYRLAIQRRTGLLLAVDGKRRKRVFLHRGDPVFVASTDPDELLGRRLVASGAVPEKMVELALGNQPPLRLGEALVSFGAIGAAQLVREVSQQLEDRVIALGRYRSGELRFYPGVELAESVHVRTKESTLHVLTRLIREQYAPSDIAGLLRPVTKEALTLGPAYRTFLALLGLTESELKALAIAEMSRTVREAVTTSTQQGVPMADALRAIFVGLCSSVLRAKGWPL